LFKVTTVINNKSIYHSMSLWGYVK